MSYEKKTDRFPQAKEPISKEESIVLMGDAEDYGCLLGETIRDIVVNEIKGGREFKVTSSGRLVILTDYYLIEEDR